MSANDLLQRFSRQRIVVIGDVMLTTYLGNARAVPDALDGDAAADERHVLTGAANVAANIQALGGQATLVGVIGHDIAGERLRAVLRAQQIAPDALIEHPYVSTLHTLRLCLADHKVATYDDGHAGHYPAQSQAALLRTLARLVAASDAVIIADHQHGLFSAEFVAALGVLVAQRAVPLIVDSPDPQRFHPAQPTVMVADRAEAHRALLAASLPVPADCGELSPEQAILLARGLREVARAEHAALCLGAQGVVLASRGWGTRHLDAEAVARVNDGGAGDAFVAGLALALAAEATPLAAVRCALAAATVALAAPWQALASRDAVARQLVRPEVAVAARADVALTSGVLFPAPYLVDHHEESNTHG